jgi:hypothetical protein
MREEKGATSQEEKNAPLLQETRNYAFFFLFD